MFVTGYGLVLFHLCPAPQLQPGTCADLTPSPCHPHFYRHATTPHTLSNLLTLFSVTCHTTHSHHSHTISHLSRSHSSHSISLLPPITPLSHNLTPLTLSYLINSSFIKFLHIFTRVLPYQSFHLSSFSVFTIRRFNSLSKHKGTPLLIYHLLFVFYSRTFLTFTAKNRQNRQILPLK